MTTGGFSNGIFSAGVPFTLASGVGVTYAGTLLKKTTTSGEVDLCGAGEHPIGYAERSTVDVFGTTQTACKISVMPHRLPSYHSHRVIPIKSISGWLMPVQ